MQTQLEGTVMQFKQLWITTDRFNVKKNPESFVFPLFYGFVVAHFQSLLFVCMKKKKYFGIKVSTKS